jgi:hypothetical protein
MKVGLSNLAVASLSVLPRPLVTEITTGLNVEHHKTFKNSQTVADKPVKRMDTKNYI